jgi:hypothetical protein
VFTTLHDLQRHVKLRCPEGTIDKPATKNVNTDVGMSDLTDIAKNDTFQHLKYKVEENNKPQWSKKFGKYVNKDQMDKARATRKADEKIKPEDKREFFRRYTHLLKLIKHLHTCDVHKCIVDDMIILHCKGDKKRPAMYCCLISIYSMDCSTMTFLMKKAMPPNKTTKKATPPNKTFLTQRVTPSLVIKTYVIRV